MSSADGYRVEQAAEMTGTTPETLRMWEHRYGWPSPKRQANGYRCFSAADLVAIRRFAALLAAGHKHADLIVDGMPRWPSQQAAPDLRAMRALRAPSGRPAAYEALRGIRAAIANRDGRALNHRLIEVVCLVHPLDRAGAGWLPALHGLVAWEAVGRPMPDAGEAWRFIRDQVGAAALAALMDQVCAQPQEHDHG